MKILKKLIRQISSSKHTKYILFFLLLIELFKSNSKSEIIFISIWLGFTIMLDTLKDNKSKH